MNSEGKQDFRPAQKFGERLRMSNENPKVIEELYLIRQEKRRKEIEDEIEFATSKEIYYK